MSGSHDDKLYQTIIQENCFFMLYFAHLNDNIIYNQKETDENWDNNFVFKGSG